jgi:lipid-A-disaccharide synthase
MDNLQPLHFPKPSHGNVDVLIIAGEHSGDLNAARVVNQVLERTPHLKIAAIGGTALKKAGAQLLCDVTGSSVIGYIEVLKKYHSFFKPLFTETLRWIIEYKPKVVCFVDYGGFNIRMATALREKGVSLKGWGSVKTLYYISPQIWASRPNRRFSIARSVDALGVIFPFEKQCYEDTELTVDFVGHPFTASDYNPPVVYNPDGPVLILPGSRKPAVVRLLPVLLMAFKASQAPSGVVLYPSEPIGALMQTIANQMGVTGIVFKPFKSAVGESPQKASAVLMSSGTISVHCALAGIPGVIAFKIDPITYLLGRILVKVKQIGLANLLLKETMYPEYIQDAATEYVLARELKDCLINKDRLYRTQVRAKALKDALAQPAGLSASDWLRYHIEGVS